MRLLIKKFKWLAGRPVVFLHPETAKKMNVFQNDRVSLENSQKIYAVVDIFSGIVKKNEIGVSEEVVSVLSIKNEKTLDVHASEFSKASIIIKQKIEGKEFSKEDIKIIIQEIVKNNLTEGEIAYFVAAQKMIGMNMNECIYLTDAMVKTGLKLKFGSKNNIVDKHCIGGIAGNRTTPIVVSICAAAGLKIPKTSSRAITSASGTADVIETIANVELNTEKLQKIVNKINGCLAWGGGLKLSPSDDKIIQSERLLNLDIESQLLASIMSKKIAAGSKKILIDIPYGKGAKFESKYDAKSLGKKFKKIAEYFNLDIEVVYTNGTQPIGNGIGPVLEMLDVLKVLKNDKEAPMDLRNKALFLSEKILKLGGIKKYKEKAKEILDSGKAYKKFVEIINSQNETNDFDYRIKQLGYAKFKKDIFANKTGFIKSIDNKGINQTCRILGCPEMKKSGIYLNKHVGSVKKGEIILTLYSQDLKKLKDAEKYMSENKIFVLK